MKIYENGVVLLKTVLVEIRLRGMRVTDKIADIHLRIIDVR